MPRSATSNRQLLRNFGTCLNFSGGSATDNVTFSDSNSLDLTTNFTITSWINPNSFGANSSARILNKDGGGTTGYSFLFDGGNKTLRVFLDNVLYSSSATTTISVFKKWYHVGVTFDSTLGSNQISFYVNGVSAGFATKSTPVTANGSTLEIGNTNAHTRCFDGMVDEVKVFNRTLSSSEILSEYQTGIVSPTGLVLYTKFDEGSGSAVIDASGNQANGVITGATYSSNVVMKQRIVSSNRIAVNGRQQAGSDIYNYDIVIIAGQSNASGRATTLNSYTGSQTGSLFGNDYLYHPLVDPTDINTNQKDSVSSDDLSVTAGSVWPIVATSITNKTGKNILLVPCAKGNTGILQWQPGANHQDRSTLYGSMIYRALQAQSHGTLKAVVWWQGENDAGNGMSQATYNSYLETIANSIGTDLGIKIVPCKLQNCSSISSVNQAAVNAAIGQAWGDNVNVSTGPDLSVINTAPEDSVHLITDAKIASAATLWWNALNGTIF